MPIQGAHHGTNCGEAHFSLLAHYLKPASTKRLCPFFFKHRSGKCHAQRSLFRSRFGDHCDRSHSSKVCDVMHIFCVHYTAIPVSPFLLVIVTQSDWHISPPRKGKIKNLWLCSSSSSSSSVHAALHSFVASIHLIGSSPFDKRLARPR